MKKLLVALLAVFAATTAFAQSGYQIQPGDTLQVEVMEDPSLNRSVLVLPDGTVQFPFAGSVRASGRSAGDVSTAIASGISSNFATTPNVFVTVQSLRETVPSTGGASMHVYMLGEIAAPGEKHLNRGTTLIQALAETGGFTKFAATKRIILRRVDRRTGKQSVHKINYKAIADGSAVGNDVVLRDGDVIIVPERRLFE
ncbi:MAG: polysaccharide export protein [Silicimonas sp.]|nr:polysaccharide export protein [Silicimonas sp.]